MIGSLDQIPAIAAYLKRIGAVAVNFRRADILKGVEGYPKVTGRVSFSGGTVSATGEAEAPTAEELAAIEAALASAEFPKMVTLVAIADPPPGVKLSDPKVFVCHNLKGEVAMIHERYDTEDGGKGFIPWTRWSDGEWRKMEPEVMPFYGVPGFKDKTTLFIHEGGKAAKRMQRMIAGELPRDRFPWFEAMRWGHHIGWIGGVWALDRSDWAGLAKLGWSRIVVVSDNDSGGRRVVPEISEHFTAPVYTIQFDTQWEHKFDLGDDWPASLFGDEGQYIGPSYDQCLQPATWATREFEVEDLTPAGRPTTRRVVEIREVFAEQWAWVEDQDLMINLDMPRYKMGAGKFNGFIRPFSHSKNTLEVFQKQYTGNQMRLTYDPSRTGIIVRDGDGLQSINQYQGSSLIAAPGSWAVWDGFCEYLFPNPVDRAEVRRWIATLRARPDIRVNYGLLLMSERQGTGKGTIARIVAELIGQHNTSYPSESLITGSEFNGWAACKRLIIVDEIYAGHNWKAYHKLKTYVTDKQLEINVKFQATWSMPNWTHYILMSNSKVALKIEAGDRRWLVPQVIEEPWSWDQFHALNQWLERGGLAHIAYWAETFEERGEGTFVRHGETAPRTIAKGELAEESRGPLVELLEQIAEELREKEGPTAIRFTGLPGWAAARLKERVFETPQQMSRILRSLGVWVTDRKKFGAGKLQLIVNQEAMLGWSVEELRPYLVGLDEVLPPEM